MTAKVSKQTPIWVAAGTSKEFTGQRRLHIDNINQEEQDLIVAFLQALQNGRDERIKLLP